VVCRGKGPLLAVGREGRIFCNRASRKKGTFLSAIKRGKAEGLAEERRGRHRACGTLKGGKKGIDGRIWKKKNCSQGSSIHMDKEKKKKTRTKGRGEASKASMGQKTSSRKKISNVKRKGGEKSNADHTQRKRRG